MSLINSCTLQTSTKTVAGDGRDSWWIITFLHSPTSLSGGFSSVCTTFGNLFVQRKLAPIIASDDSRLPEDFSAGTWWSTILITIGPSPLSGKASANNTSSFSSISNKASSSLSSKSNNCDTSSVVTHWNYYASRHDKCVVGMAVGCVRARHGSGVDALLPSACVESHPQQEGSHSEMQRYPESNTSPEV